MNPFTERETSLVHRLGLSREEIKLQRDALLKERIDWLALARGAIHWTASAVAKVETALQLKNAPGAPQTDSSTAESTDEIKTPPGEHTEAHAPAEVVEEMTVHRCNFPNSTLIQARRKDGSVVTVRVRSSKHFRPTLPNGRPMTLPVRREGSWWVAVRCPRWPGKW